ncbi:hypothetical protein ABZ412_13380 [Nocardia sp. NPDC005746]
MSFGSVAAVMASETVPTYSGPAVAIGTAILLFALAALAAWVLFAEHHHR